VGVLFQKNQNNCDFLFPSPRRERVLLDRIEGRRLRGMAIFPAVGMAGFGLERWLFSVAGIVL